MKKQKDRNTFVRALLLGTLALVAVTAAERIAVITDPPVPIASGSGFPLRFEPVAGGDRDALVANALNGVVTFDGSGLSLTGSKEGDGWTIALVDSAAEAGVQTSNPSRGPTNVFVGSQSATWQRGVTAYSRAGSRSVYPGVDLAISGTTDRVGLRFDAAN